MKIFHYRVARMQNIPNFVSIIGINFIQVLIVHDNACKLIHKKSYHGDINYHMTLNKTFIAPSLSSTMT